MRRIEKEYQGYPEPQAREKKNVMGRLPRELESMLEKQAANMYREAELEAEREAKEANGQNASVPGRK